MDKKPQATPPPRNASLLAICLRKFFNFLGYVGVMFILYGVLSIGTGSVWLALERWVTPASALLTLVGALVTASSVYFYRPYQYPPEGFSRCISAPFVMIGSVLALDMPIVLVPRAPRQLPPAFQRPENLNPDCIREPEA